MIKSKVMWSYPMDMETKGQLNPQEWEVYRMAYDEARARPQPSSDFRTSHEFARDQVQAFRQFVKEDGG